MEEGVTLTAKDSICLLVHELFYWYSSILLVFIYGQYSKLHNARRHVLGFSVFPSIYSIHLNVISLERFSGNSSNFA